jgi:hypothetical protein
VRQQTSSLEAAVRAEMWRQVLGASPLPPTYSETTAHDDLIG